MLSSFCFSLMPSCFSAHHWLHSETRVPQRSLFWTMQIPVPEGHTGSAPPITSYTGGWAHPLPLLRSLGSPILQGVVANAEQLHNSGISLCGFLCWIKQKRMRFYPRKWRCHRAGPEWNGPSSLKLLKDGVLKWCICGFTICRFKTFPTGNFRGETASVLNTYIFSSLSLCPNI